MKSDLDSLLRTTKQNYKSRLDSLTDRLKSICSEDTFVTSADNFASRIRIQDLQDDSKPPPQDTSYLQLSDEVNRSRSLIRSLQKDNEWLDHNLAQSKEELWNEKRRHTETQKELTEFRQSVNLLQSSITSIQNEYHDVLKRKGEDAKLTSSEFSKMKAEFDKADKTIWQKNIEMELLRQEFKSEKLNNETLNQEINYLKKKLREEEEKALKWKKAYQESEFSCQELRDRLRQIENEKDKLQKCYYELERENEERETSIQNLKEDLTKSMEFQATERQNYLASMQKKYKDKKAELLRTIDELNSKLDEYKEHISETRSYVEKERYSHATEIDKYKLRIKQLEDEARNLMATSKGHIQRELQDEKRQFDEEKKLLKEQYENILHRRIQDYDSISQKQRQEYEDKLALANQQYQETVQNLEQRIVTLNKHNEVLSDTIDTIKQDYSKKLKNQEEELTTLHENIIVDIENRHNQELAHLSSQGIKYETLAQNLTEEKNSLSVQLEEELNRSSVLEVRLQNLQESIAYLEDIKKNFSEQVDELTTELQNLQSEQSDVKQSSMELEKDREDLAERVKDLETVLSETNKEYEFRIAQVTNDYQIKLETLQYQYEELEDKKAELKSELDILQDLCQQLERQKLQGKRDIIKIAERHQEEVRQVKESLMNQFDQEAQEHIISRNELMKLERELYKEREKSSELNTSRETYKSQVEKYEKEMQSLLRILNESEKNCKNLQDRKEIVEKDMKRAQIRHNKVMNIMKTAFVKAKSKFVSEMNALQSDVIELSGRYKRNIHEEISKALRIIADKQFKLTKSHNEDLYSLETKHKSLLREFERYKSDSESLLASSQQNLTEQQTQFDILKRRLDSEKNYLETELEDHKNSHNDGLMTIEVLGNEVKRLREEVLTKEKLLHDREVQFDYDIKNYAATIEAEQKHSQYTEKRMYDEEIRSLQSRVNDLTSSSHEIMDNLHNDIVKLQLQHREELQYQQLKIQEQRESIKNNEELLGWYRSEMVKIQEMVDFNERNAQTTLIKLERDTEEVLTALLQERQRMSDFKQEKISELDEMNSSMRELYSELDIKNETIVQLLHEKEELRTKLRESHMESLRSSNLRVKFREDGSNL